MPLFLYHAVTKADRILSRWQTKFFEKQGSLLVLFLHGIFQDRKELESGAAYPQQETTVQKFEELIEYFQATGYEFVSPAQLLRGLSERGRYAMVTFDDGYFNNTRAVPVLRKYNVPATVFVSVGHVLEQKGYWWEGLYQVRRTQGVPLRKIYEEASRLNVLSTEEVERQLVEQFGPVVLKPRGDADRPMTREELRAFSTEPLITIGNHTFNHNVLTAYNAPMVREIIRKAQEALRSIIGTNPECIAYPNGEFTDEIAKIAQEEGLKLGFTTIARKEYLPRVLREERRMVIGRFCPNPIEDAQVQYEHFRSDLMLRTRLQELKPRSRRGY
jgi:peptidoglycan/xylan/chitin deacetylase (PgdA/CDA1 family)